MGCNPVFAFVITVSWYLFLTTFESYCLVNLGLLLSSLSQNWTFFVGPDPECRDQLLNLLPFSWQLGSWLCSFSLATVTVTRSQALDVEGSPPSRPSALNGRGETPLLTRSLCFQLAFQIPHRYWTRPWTAPGLHPDHLRTT